jgi:superfamily I DNA and RNA helicase
LQIEVIKCVSLSHIQEICKTYDVLAIDDAHRFPDIELCDSIAQNNKTVIVSVQDGDHNQSSYPNILKLVS